MSYTLSAVKTDSPNVYRPPTLSAVPIQAYYTLRSSQTRLSEPLRATYLLFGDHNRLCDTLQDSYIISAVKTDSTRIYWTRTCIVAVTTDSAILQVSYTLSEVKPTLRASTVLLHVLRRQTIKLVQATYMLWGG